MDLDWIRLRLSRGEGDGEQAGLEWRQVDSLLLDAEAQWNDQAGRSMAANVLAVLRTEAEQVLAAQGQQMGELRTATAHFTEAREHQGQLLQAMESFEEAQARGNLLMQQARTEAEQANRTALEALETGNSARDILADIRD